MFTIEKINFEWHLACFRPVRVVLDDWLDGIMLFLLLMLMLLSLHALRLLHLESLLIFLRRLTEDGRWRRSVEKKSVFIFYSRVGHYSDRDHGM